MATHAMSLQPKFYDFIKTGTKRIEIRLFDEKRQQIRIGDTIIFSKSEEDKIEVKVTEILRYASFADLLDDFDISILADKSMTKEELLLTLNEFYTPEKQKEFGVVSIRIMLFKSRVKI